MKNYGLLEDVEIDRLMWEIALSGYLERLKEQIRKKDNMKSFTDIELTELADWAEKNSTETLDQDEKKAFNALRQGADWMLRSRVKKRQRELEVTGSQNSGPVGTARRQ